MIPKLRLYLEYCIFLGFIFKTMLNYETSSTNVKCVLPCLFSWHTWQSKDGRVFMWTVTITSPKLHSVTIELLSLIERDSKSKPCIELWAIVYVHTCKPKRYTVHSDFVWPYLGSYWDSESPSVRSWPQRGPKCTRFSGRRNLHRHGNNNM